VRTENLRELIGIPQVAGEKFIHTLAAYIHGDNFDPALSQKPAHLPPYVAAGTGYQHSFIVGVSLDHCLSLGKNLDQIPAFVKTCL
jgi:hypothetical protein